MDMSNGELEDDHWRSGRSFHRKTAAAVAAAAALAGAAAAARAAAVAAG